MSDTTVTGSGSASGGGSTPVRANQQGAQQNNKNQSAPASNQNQNPRGQGDHTPLGDVRELGDKFINAARNGANSLFEEQRNRAAEEIAALGKSLEESSKSLDGFVGETVAPYAQNAARQVSDFADTLRNRSISQIGSDIEGFARQWPLAFMAAAIGVGFVAGRFLLSSGSPIANAFGQDTHRDTHDGATASTRSGENRGMTTYSTAASTSAGTSSAGPSSTGKSSTGTSTAGTSTAGTSTTEAKTGSKTGVGGR